MRDVVHGPFVFWGFFIGFRSESVSEKLETTSGGNFSGLNPSLIYMALASAETPHQYYFALSSKYLNICNLLQYEIQSKVMDTAHISFE